MATTDFDFNQTRNEIISRAMRMVGAIGLGQTLSAEQLDQGIIALNSIVKEWQTRHIFLWTMEARTESFIADQISAVLDNDVLSVDKVFYVDGDDHQPIQLISYRDYQMIPDKSYTSGNPVQAAYDYGKSTPTLYLYPAPNAALDVRLFVVKRLQDMDTAAGNADIPQQFLEALTYALADGLSDEYPTPIVEKQRLKAKADEKFSFCKQSDYERQDVEFVSSAFRSR